jgi:hypothetical protein
MVMTPTAQRSEPRPPNPSWRDELKAILVASFGGSLFVLAQLALYTAAVVDGGTSVFEALDLTTDPVITASLEPSIAIGGEHLADIQPAPGTPHHHDLTLNMPMRILAAGRGIATYAWAPASRTFVFVDGRFTVWRWTAPGRPTKVVNLTEAGQVNGIEGIDTTPNANWIVIGMDRTPSGSDIWLIRSRDGKLFQITDNSDATDPVLLWETNEIAYISDVAHARTLWVQPVGRILDAHR